MTTKTQKKRRSRSIFGDKTPEQAALYFIKNCKSSKFRKEMIKTQNAFDKMRMSMRPKTRNGELIIY